MNASDNYRLLKPEEVAEVAARCADAWKDSGIPEAQYELCVKPELAAYKEGKPIAPFDALVRCLWSIPESKYMAILEVGASSAYNSEVIKIAGFKHLYEAVDYSPAFRDFAKTLYPGIPYFVGNTHNLPFSTGAFDVVISGSVILHTAQYEKAISETARVAKSYAIFHRTPVSEVKPTECYLKEAYGVPVIEYHFNEAELLGLFARHGLKVVYQTDVFWDGDFGHRDYLCSKEELAHYPA